MTGVVLPQDSLRRIYGGVPATNRGFTPRSPTLHVFKFLGNAVMPGWLSLLCGIVVIVAAAYLLLVILRPEKF